MGEVVRFIPDGESFVVHKDGWERGTRVKGKWEGPYEALYVMERGTIYIQGECKNNLLNGPVLETVSLKALEDGTGQATTKLNGECIEGKKEGGFQELTYDGETFWNVVWYSNNKEVQRDEIS